MLVRLNESTTRIGFRLKDWKGSRYLTDWRNLQLVIRPGQHDQPCWVPGGSPIILHGFWPNLPTEVDIANPPPPDFPSFVMPAFDHGDDCTVVFLLPDRFKSVPWGRYTGELRWCPDGPARVVNLNQPPKKKPKKTLDFIPPKYLAVCCAYCEPKPLPPPPPPPHPMGCCILAVFDIEVGQRCDDYIVDMVTVDYALNTCEEC